MDEFSTTRSQTKVTPRQRRGDETPTQLEKLGDETPDEPPVVILWSPPEGNQTCHPPCQFPLDIFPDPERLVVRPGHNVAVRRSNDARDLRPSRRRRAIDAFVRPDAGAALSPCARSASGGGAGRRVPHLKRVVPRPGHDAVVRQGSDALDLRPSRRRRAIDARFDWTPAPRPARVPAQRLEVLTGRSVPHLERPVARPGHDAAVREDADAIDLRPSRRRAIDRAVRLDAGAALSCSCAGSASGGTDRSTHPTP